MGMRIFLLLLFLGHMQIDVYRFFPAGERYLTDDPA